MPLIDELRARFSALNNAGSANPAATPGVTEPSTTPTPTPAPAPTPATTPAPTVPETQPAPAAEPTPEPATTPDTGSGSGSSSGTIGFYAPGTQGEDDEATKVTFAAQRIIDTATATVDRLIAEGKLYSAGRQVALAAFTSAAFADEDSGPDVVTFTRADGRKLDSRVAKLAEMFDSVPQHSLFSAGLPVHALNGNKGNATENQRVIEEAEKQAKAFNESMGVLAPVPGGITNNGKH